MTKQTKQKKAAEGSKGYIKLSPLLEKRKDLIAQLDRIAVSWSTIEKMQTEKRNQLRKVINDAQDLVFNIKSENDASKLAAQTIEMYANNLSKIVDDLNASETKV